MRRDVTWTLSIDTVAARLGAFILTAHAAVSAIAALRVTRPGTALLSCLVLLAVQLGLAALCLARSYRPRGLLPRAVAAGGLGLVAASVAAASPELPTFAVVLLPANAAQAVQVVAIVFVPRLRTACLLVAATCPAALVIGAVTTDRALPDMLQDWVLAAGTTFTLLVLRHLLRGNALELDAADREVAELAAARAALEAAELAAEESRRVLHDRVVSALRCVELGVPPEQLRSSARSALTHLARTPELGDERAVLHELVELAPVRVRVHREDWAALPPPRVAAAITAATGEALRNVARHAGVEEAELVISGDAGRCVVEVRDRGRGLPYPLPEGYGLRRSIRERMHQVGGRSEVHRGEGGRGTVVRLEWTAPRTDAPRGATAPSARVTGLLAGRTSATNAALVLPSGVANTYVGLRNLGDSPAAGVAMVVAVVTLLGVLAVSVDARRPHPALLVLLLAAAWGTTVVGLAVQPPGALLDLRSWVVGAVGIGLALVAFHRGWRWALLGLTGQVVVVLVVAARDPAVALTAPVGALVTPVWQVAVATLPGYWLRRAERRISTTAAALRRQEEDRVWLRVSEEARHAHLAHLESDVVPFLESLAHGEEWPGRTRAARLLEARCRDDLNLAEPMPGHARRAVREARHAGVDVDIRTGADLVEVPAAAWDALVGVLAEVRSGARVTLTPPRTPGGPARVAVVPAVADPGRAVPGVTVTQAPGLTVLRVSTEEPTRPGARVRDEVSR
ncbi:hypothetical protein [Nocardioides nanhaiensis]|uniref:sensor histidine kinase n=1 Tax=Nocardioides nanhaiensis TaxID=1476871 RepID=UPI0031E5A1D8